MPAEPSISRRTLVLIVLGLGVLVIGGTLASRRVAAPANDSARRLLESRILGSLDGALSATEFTGADLQALARLERPDIGVLDHRTAVLLFMLRGRLDEGVSRYRRMLDERPQDPGILFGLGSLMLARGRTAEARRLLERAWSLDSEQWPAALRVAACLAAEGRVEDALAICERVQAGHGEPANLRLADSYGNAGLALLAMRRPAEALEAANRAIAFRQDDASTVAAAVDMAQDLLIRGSIFIALDSPQEAKRDLQDALQLARSVEGRALEVRIVATQAALAEKSGDGRTAAELRRQAGELVDRYTDEERLGRLLALPDLSSRPGPS